MAHENNIEIPARFSFRPYLAAWHMCDAEIVGWGEKPPVLSKAFVAPITPPSGETDEKVIVRLSSNRGLYGPTAGMLMMEHSCSIEIERSNIPVEVLQPRENPRTAPDVAGREFPVLVCHRPEFENFFPVPKPEGAEKDAWKMREEFFEMEEGTWALRQFLNRWGLWNWERGYNAGMASGREPHDFMLVFPRLIWERREQLRLALAGKPRAWLSSARPLDFTRAAEPPYFLVERFYCGHAIEATITIDHLSNARFGICKRKDCRRLFKRETKQKKIYCCQPCAHLESVRKQRREAARQKRKAARERERSNEHLQTR